MPRNERLPTLPPPTANEITSLAGIWKFVFLGHVDSTTIDLSLAPQDRMAVPACFDTFPDYLGKRGLAHYRLDLEIEDEGRYRLWIDGAHHWCRVYFDGQDMGGHTGGFTRFSLNIGYVKAGTFPLDILIDNRIDYDRCPLHLDYFDWYQYGGLTRGVWLQRLQETQIERIDVSTIATDPPRIRIDISYTCQDRPTAATALLTRINGQEALSKHVALENSGTVGFELELPGVSLWSPESPHLHELEVTLAGHVRTQRFGIRTVGVKDSAILLNGESLRLLGFCRHEISEPYGHTQSPELLLADLQRIRATGANFVRGSHYPQDERFLDLCDELGILVWCESTAWQPRATHLADPAFLDAHAQISQEMVSAANHHPSVIIWGVFNEGDAFDPATRPSYAQALDQLRQLDGTRPVTAAVHMIEQCTILDLVDLVAVNTYPGWYLCELDKVEQALDAVAKTVEGMTDTPKPLLISELGGGAIWGNRDAFANRWSEEYQANLLHAALGHILSHPETFVGIAIWQFSDGRTSEFPTRVLDRPRGFNNKGIFDEFRRPKLAVETVTFHYKSVAAGKDRPAQT